MSYLKSASVCMQSVPHCQFLGKKRQWLFTTRQLRASSRTRQFYADLRKCKTGITRLFAKNFANAMVSRTLKASWRHPQRRLGADNQQVD